METGGEAFCNIGRGVRSDIRRRTAEVRLNGYRRSPAYGRRVAREEGRSAVFHHDEFVWPTGTLPEMNRLRASTDRSVAFYAVQVDNTVSDAAVKKYAQEFGYSFPMLNDPQLTLARLTGAKVTPEVAVLSSRAGFCVAGRVINKVKVLHPAKVRATERTSQITRTFDAVLAENSQKPRRRRWLFHNLESKIEVSPHAACLPSDGGSTAVQ